VALAVALTRVVLTDHYVGDVIAGAILGSLTALALRPVFGIAARP
jgi:membrane-associated phospholipid phosphatase